MKRIEQNVNYEIIVTYDVRYLKSSSEKALHISGSFSCLVGSHSPQISPLCPSFVQDTQSSSS